MKNLIPGMEYLFQLKTINGLDSSTAIEKKVNTSEKITYSFSFLLFFFCIYYMHAHTHALHFISYYICSVGGEGEMCIYKKCVWLQKMRRSVRVK